MIQGILVMNGQKNKHAWLSIASDRLVLTHLTVIVHKDSNSKRVSGLTSRLSVLWGLTSSTPFFFSSVLRKMITMVAPRSPPSVRSGSDESRRRPSSDEVRVHVARLAEKENQLVTSHLPSSAGALITAAAVAVVVEEEEEGLEVEVGRSLHTYPDPCSKRKEMEEERL